MAAEQFGQLVTAMGEARSCGQVVGGALSGANFEQLVARFGIEAQLDDLEEISRAEAEELTAELMTSDMAYSAELMPPNNASKFAKSLFELIPSNDVTFYRGGLRDMSSTFSNGFVALGPAYAACFIVTDED
jgi:hypothetical protein